MKIRTFIGMAALIAISLSGGIVAAQEDNRPELRIAVQKNPETQEPVDAASNVAFRNNPSIHETLLKLDLDGHFSVQPNLATSWRWIDDKTLEVKLRKGVIFHDGREMTAEDVAFSFGPERLTDPKAPGYPTYLTSFSSLAHVDVVDPDTVRFVTKFKDPILLQRLASYAAVVISKDAWIKMGGDWAKWKQKPVAPGPTRFSNLSPMIMSRWSLTIGISVESLMRSASPSRWCRKCHPVSPAFWRGIMTSRPICRRISSTW